MKAASTILTLFSFILFACSKKQVQENVYFFDYEQAAGWSTIQLESGFAKSGKFCEKITPDKVYSNTFILSLAEVGTQPLKKIKASVWVTAPEMQQDVQLVIDMFSPTESKSIKNTYLLIPAVSLQGKGDWLQFKTELDIAGIADGSILAKVFIWNPGGQKCFLDDFQISFE